MLLEAAGGAHKLLISFWEKHGGGEHAMANGSNPVEALEGTRSLAPHPHGAYS